MKALLLALLLAPAPARAAAPAAHPNVGTLSEFGQLVNRTRSNADFRQDVNGHRVSVRVKDVAIEGQVCPGGRVPRCQVFLAEPMAPDAPRVYYLRMAALCVGASGAPDLMLFSLDADADGVVQDWVLGDLSDGTITNGFTGTLTDAERLALDRHRAALLALFLQ